MSNDSISLHGFLTKFTENYYTISSIYNQDSQVKYILLLTPLQRKPFLLDIPDTLNIHSSRFDYTLIQDSETNYKSFRQRDYLSNLSIDNIACITEQNITIKKNGIQVYIFKETITEETDSNDEDIVVDEYKVSNVYPVFNIINFLKEIANFEMRVNEQYSLLTQVEEEYNEAQVIKVIEKFEIQKKDFKEMLFNVHKNGYNIRRDIEKASLQLEKLYNLKKNSLNEKDRVRFKLERLISEMENKLDHLNEQLSQYRNMGDSILTKYNDYMSKKLI
jgi:hypothetical protein